MFFCICELEWCWCGNFVPTLDTPCDDCAAGNHVTEEPV